MPVYEKKGRKGAGGQRVWRVVLWVDGKSQEKLVSGTKKDALTAEAQWRVELASGASSPKGKGPAVDLLTFSRGPYAEHAMTHLRPKTWEVRRYQLATLCKHMGTLTLTALTTEVIDRYKAKRTAEGAQPRTVNTELAKLQAVMAYARDVGVPCASPKVRRLPEIGRGRVTFWNAEQLSMLFAAVEREALDLLPVVTFLANTGCRKGEALACEQSWVDLKRGILTVAPNADWQPKDNEPREIPISDALRPWLERALATKGRYVFTTAHKHAGRERTRWVCWPRLAFDRARKAAGLKGGPHTLRHSFAAAFLAGCPDMFLLAQILGHSTTRTTRIYAHLLPAHLEKARNVVNVGSAMAMAEAPPRIIRTMASDHGQNSDPLGPVCDPSGFYRVGTTGFEPATPTVSR